MRQNADWQGYISVSIDNTFAISHIIFSKSEPSKMMIKKLTHFINKPTSTRERLRHRQKTYKPATRLQKIRLRTFQYPSSSDNKIIIPSNNDGNGFKRIPASVLSRVPSHLPLQDMLHGINAVCYQQWRIAHDKIQKNQFQWIDIGIIVFFVIILIIIGMLFILMEEGEYSIMLYCIYLLSFVMLASLIVCVIVFFTKKHQENIDQAMISAIRAQLRFLNQKAMEETIEDRPKYVWTCQKQCVWIACAF